jgi:hypothetical protein
MVDGRHLREVEKAGDSLEESVPDSDTLPEHPKRFDQNRSIFLSSQPRSYVCE